MSLSPTQIALTAIAVSILVPTAALPQSATACVDSSYKAFLSEMDRLESDDSFPEGIELLTAHGWIRATSACLDHAVYPNNKQQAVAEFRSSIDRLLDEFAEAIRTDSIPPIYAMAMGGPSIRMVPDKAPTASAPAQSGLFMLSLDDAKRLQRALQRRGFYNGQIDGVLGENSYRAIRRYQRSIGKPMTGVLSPQDLRDLM